MEISIRQLKTTDLHHVEKMNTGIEDDYILRVYDRISSGSSRMYGLFIDEHLASVGGYTIFAEQYIMLGRMRSDLHYRGNNFSTQLMKYIVEQTSLLPNIQWIGANTQQDNVSARRVMNKIGLTDMSTLYSATSIDISILENDGKVWRKVTDLSQKKAWLEQLYIQTGAVFPYECYYTFPASEKLFTDENLVQWSFFENSQQNRVLITKPDYKGNDYLHAVYPWDDLVEQPGLWETISMAQQQLTKNINTNAYVWIDLSPAQVHFLPTNHPFKLPSPWLLYSMSQPKS